MKGSVSFAAVSHAVPHARVFSSFGSGEQGKQPWVGRKNRDPFTNRSVTGASNLMSLRLSFLFCKMGYLSP